MPSRVTSTEGVINLVSVGDKSIMPQKLDPPFVQAQFELAGYTMLSEYISSKKDIEFQCNQGHFHRISWDSFKQGHRCGVCSPTLKLTHEYISSKYLENGYILIDKYKSSETKMKVICPSGHEVYSTWDHFKKGHRCAICKGLRISHEEVEKKFRDRGYVLKSRYENSTKKMHVVCPKGHEIFTSYSAFLVGNCIYCSGQIVEHETAKKYFESQGYTLLSQYKNCKEKLAFICPNGHRSSMNWSNFFIGKHRCRYCHSNVTKESFDELLALSDYKMIGEYKSTNQKVAVLCPKGHVTSITYNNFKIGKRCGICNSENFYTNYRHRALLRIQSRIKEEIKRSKLNIKWQDVYSSQYLQDIASPLLIIYDKCPKGFVVDHIVPVSCFNLLDEVELKACWDPNNLRYLTAAENSARGNRITMEEVNFMKINFPVIISGASRLSVNF